MKTLLFVINIIIAIYLFLMANFLFWGSIIALFAMIAKPSLSLSPWLIILNMLLAPFFIYGTIIFFRKVSVKYNYGIILLLIVWLETQVSRFFFITHNKLEKTDLSNLLFFGIPFLIIYLTKRISRKLRLN
jgi:hypothetical protein